MIGQLQVHEIINESEGHIAKDSEVESTLSSKLRGTFMIDEQCPLRMHV